MTTNRVGMAAVTMTIAAALFASDAVAGAPRFALEMGGASGGWLHAVEGATADANAKEPMKHVADAKKPDLNVDVSDVVTESWLEWMRASFDHKHVRKDGSIHLVNGDATVEGSLEFTGGLITEIGLPAIDGGKSPAASKMSIKISPETTRFKKGSGKIDPSKFETPTQQGRPIPTKFHFDFAGCGQPCTKASSLSAARYTLTKGTLTVSNLHVRVAPGPSVDDWVKKKDAREGTLAYLSGNGVFLSFKLHGLKPTHASPTTTNAGPAVDLDLAASSVETTP